MLFEVFDGEFFDDDRRDRTVAEGCYSADRTNDFHAFDDFAEYGMMAVEPRCFVEGDEELRAACVGACVCHGEDAFGRMAKAFAEFIGDGVARAARAVAVRVAALDHESVDDAMEDEAVVEAVVGEVDEVLCCFRGFVTIEFDGKGSFGRLEYCDRVVGVAEFCDIGVCVCCRRLLLCGISRATAQEKECQEGNE